MHLASLPDERKDKDPGGACLGDDRASFDNVAFPARVVRAAAALAGQGVGAGDVVALVLPNCAEFVVALFAAWRLDAAVTPVNPALTDGEVAYQVADSAARLLVGDRTVPGVTTIPVSALDESGEETPRDDLPSDERSLALLIYTSGTTGRPKGVMLDHANLSAMCAMCVTAVQLTAEDHCLLILPLFHVNGIVVSVLSPLIAGGRTTVADRFSPTNFFRVVEAARPTYFSAVPAIYAMLSALPEEEQPDLSSLRVAVCGAAPMPAELLDRFEQRYGVAVVEGYGLSEGTCASTINPVDGRRKPGTVGLPLPGQDVAVMAPDGGIVQDGSAGEVVVRGPNVMRGYLNRPEETAKTLVDGWLRTGDVGRFDEDGYLVLVERIKDMIIRGGENIYPKEIESVLYTHPAVLEAAVVGRPDEVLGEVPVAHVSLRPRAGADVDELERLCAAQLSAYKRPVTIHIVPDLPKNSVGKIDKLVLRTRAAATARV